MRYSFFIFLFIPFIVSAQNNLGTINGRVIGKETNEPLFGCNIVIERLSIGTTSDKDGKFSLKAPFGTYEIKISYIGKVSSFQTITISPQKQSIYLHIKLEPSTLLGKEITVHAQADQASIIAQKIEPQDIIKIPNIYSDVLRSIQILSGVSSNNELSSGYNVHGGTFDENLIYLNGYEIFRPFLLRQGVEENQSIINQEMVSSLKFYNGAFPAQYGDKMSSALDVNYSADEHKKIGGVARIDFMNLGLALKGTIGKLNWLSGFRLAYPTMFMKQLQTKGDYKPSFSDFQFFGTYSISSDDRLEIFFLSAVNQYDLIPKEWIGHFQTSRAEVHQVTIKEDGEKKYSFNTNLAALKYIHNFNSGSTLSFSLSKYFSKENEKSDLVSDLFYSPEAESPEQEVQYLFKRIENIKNSISFSSYYIRSEFRKSFGNHSALSGLEFRLVNLINRKNEYYVEEGNKAIQIIPVVQKSENSYNLNSLAFFFEDTFALGDLANTNLGFRFLQNYFTKETLFSPRLSISYHINSTNIINLGFGIYYQPPFVTELSGSIIEPGNLKSQRSEHLKLGWENQFKEKVKFSLELYYKKLDNIIPFYYDDLKIIPLNGNTNKGYAFGFDMMFQGQVVEGIDSWLGYGYLNSKEKEMNSNKPYHRRLLDQTHTLQIFLQDRFRKHRNWQSHLRFLVGSGFLYNYRLIVKNPNTGINEFVVNLDNPQEYFLYLRADMGLTAAFKISNSSKLTFSAEILNVFNHYNIAGYEWVRIFDNANGVVKIPKILSKRFFNIKVEFEF